jgi:hypothetical protein
MVSLVGDYRDQALAAGLAQLSAGLLQGGAPSYQPGGFGRGLGQGLAGFTPAMQGYMRNAYTADLLKQSAADQQRKAQAQQQYENLLAGIPTPEATGAAMAQPGVRPGPTPQAARSLTGADPLAGVNPLTRSLLGTMDVSQGAPAMIGMMNKSPIAAAPGTTLLDPRTYKPIYTSPEKPPEGFQRGPDGSLSLVPGYAEGKGQIASLTEPLQKVMNPDGTVNYVPRSQAIGKTAPDEAMVVMGPDGKPLFMRGGSQAIQAMQSGLTKAGQDKVQDQLIDMTAQMSQVNRIKGSFKPEFQQIGTRAGLSWDAIRDKAGMNLNAQERQGVAEFAKYKAEAGQYFADRLKAMSGAAVTEQEMKRQEAYLPNPGSGVFDGDSPTQFSAKVERMQDFMQKATARLHYVSKKGMNISQVPLEDMPKIIRDRGNELAKSIEGRGLDDAAVKDAVRRQLAKEFGLVSE